MICQYVVLFVAWQEKAINRLCATANCQRCQDIHLPKQPGNSLFVRPARLCVYKNLVPTLFPCLSSGQVVLPPPSKGPGYIALCEAWSTSISSGAGEHWVITSYLWVESLSLFFSFFSGFISFSFPVQSTKCTWPRFPSKHSALLPRPPVWIVTI